MSKKIHVFIHIWILHMCKHLTTVVLVGGLKHLVHQMICVPEHTSEDRLQISSSARGRRTELTSLTLSLVLFM